MKYILTVNNFLTAEDFAKLSEIGSIVYESKLLPIIAVETDTPNLLGNFGFIKSKYESRKGELLTVSMDPTVPTHDLIAANLVGWQVNVAILDSGFNNNNILSKTIDVIGVGIQDDVVHGTVVSKIVHKFAPGSQIIGIKVCQNQHVDEVNVLQGLEEAYFNNAKVVNCSFGFPRSCDGSCAVCQFIELLDAKGILVVAAAGNTGPDQGSIGCPGNAPLALTIGAIDPDGTVAKYSGRGSLTQNKPDLLAPGTVQFELYEGSGTSFSTPVISGVLASFLQVYTDHKLVKRSICGSAIDLRYEPHIQGAGLLNISGALEVLKNVTDSGSIQG